MTGISLDAVLPDTGRGQLLPVAEVFGPTIQGEGRNAGQRAMFARLGLCNLSCSWCDTPYTWDRARFDLAAECPDMDAAELADLLTNPVTDDPTPVPAWVSPPALVVLTGGEPLIHQQSPGWRTLVDLLDEAGRMVHVETNGTIAPSPATESRVQHFAVSPKLASNGTDPAHRRLKPHALGEFARLAVEGRADFKFVATGRADLPEVAALVETHQVPANRVWIMPEGTTADQVIAGQQALADEVVAYGWNLSTRLHVLLWGPERGR